MALEAARIQDLLKRLLVFPAEAGSSSPGSSPRAPQAPLLEFLQQRPKDGLVAFLATLSRTEARNMWGESSGGWGLPCPLEMSSNIRNIHIRRARTLLIQAQPAHARERNIRSLSTLERDSLPTHKPGLEQLGIHQSKGQSRDRVVKLPMVNRPQRLVQNGTQEVRVTFHRLQLPAPPPRVFGKFVKRWEIAAAVA